MTLTNEQIEQYRAINNNDADPNDDNHVIEIGDNAFIFAQLEQPTHHLDDVRTIIHQHDEIERLRDALKLVQNDMEHGTAYYDEVLIDKVKEALSNER
jgi:hypothetical protein